MTVRAAPAELPAVVTTPGRPFGVYLHVPFCATRCGYCDFNTYTAVELGGGASQASYASTAVAEVRLARTVLGSAAARAAPLSLGGAPPTPLPPRARAALLAAGRDQLGRRPGRRRRPA